MPRGRQRRLGDPTPDLGTRTGERRDIIDIERCQPRGDARLEIVMHEELAEGERGGREPAGDANSGVGELTDHFAQRRVLAADERNVGDRCLGKPADPRSGLLNRHARPL